MKQHFTQSKASRNLSLRMIAGISNEKALQLLRQVRWADNDGKPICPRCGCKSCVTYRVRPIYKCRECKHPFSITSGSIFASRKMSAAQYLFVVARFVMNAKGCPSVEMAREAGNDPGSIFVLQHKLREAMASENAGVILKGEVEIDGCYIGKYVKPANHAENRVDRRRRQNISRNKKCIGVARQRKGPALVQVNKRETDFRKFVIDRVDHNAVVYADEAYGWDVLGETFLIERINHEECYAEGNITTNQAESFFSRIRRAEEGIYHHISSRYADLYAEEMAWRENNRRLGDSERFLKLLSLALKHPVSARFAGYWQRSGAR